MISEQGTTYHITQTERNAIRTVAALLHAEFGAKKVRQLAKLLEWKVSVDCGMCDTTVPLIFTSAGDECMICGSDDLAIWNL